MVAQIWELIDVQMDRGQVDLTVYHFLDADGVADPEQMVSDFIEFVIPPIASVQGANITHTAIKYRQVYPTAELGRERTLTPVITGGEAGTDPLPSYATYSVKWALGLTVPLAGSDGKHIRRGGKHLPGPTEFVVNGDTVTNVDVIATFATWASAARIMGSDNWQLVVASFKTGPTTRQAEVSKYAPVIGATAPGLGTQNTRKVLRGRTY